MSESNPKTTEMDESTTTNNETGSNSQNGGAGNNTSAMARALKHELEAKSMDVEIEDDGETLSAEKLGENYRILPDGTVEGNGALKEGIERIVTDLDVDSDTESAAEEQASQSVQQDEASPDVGMGEESENETNPASSESEGPAENSPTPDAETAESNEADPEEEDEEALPTGNVQLFEASIEVSNIQDTIDAAHAIVDECRIHLDTDGFIIKAVDPANVAMVDEFVSSDAFESYDTDCGEIGVNIERLDDVIGIADNSDDLVQLSLNPETRKLDVQINTVEYTLALIDPDAIRSEPEIPDLDLPASFTIEQDHLKRAIRATDMVADHIKLRADKQEGFIAEGTGDTDDVELKTPPEDLENAELADVDSLFSLDYLDDFRKPFKSDTVVDVLLGDDFPLKFSFEMADGNAEITYMLAPRIQND